MKRKSFPSNTFEKRNELEKVIRCLADHELKSSKPNINNIFVTLYNWKESGFENGFPLNSNLDTFLKTEDINEVLIESGSFGDSKQEMLGFFVVQTLLDSVISYHDQVYANTKYQNSGSLGVDKYLEDGNLAYITSKMNARGYLSLLGAENINYFLELSGNKSVSEYMKMSGGGKVK